MTTFRIVITQTRTAHEEIEADSQEEAERIAAENASTYDYGTMEPTYAVDGEWWYTD